MTRYIGLASTSGWPSKSPGSTPHHFIKASRVELADSALHAGDQGSILVPPGISLGSSSNAIAKRSTIRSKFKRGWFDRFPTIIDDTFTTVHVEGG